MTRAIEQGGTTVETSQRGQIFTWGGIYDNDGNPVTQTNPADAINKYLETKRIARPIDAAVEKHDNLTEIAGIGVFFAEMLKVVGIHNFVKLADQSAENLFIQLQASVTKDQKRVLNLLNPKNSSSALHSWIDQAKVLTGKAV